MSNRLGEEYGFLTRSVHAGNDTDGTGEIRKPIVMADSHATPYASMGLGWSDTDTLL